MDDHDPIHASRLRRWRLVLGSEPPSPDRSSAEGINVELQGDDAEMDHILQALYDSDRKGGLGSSSPRVNRWLGDIRRYFPVSVVRLMQKDALERLKLHQMLLQPETLESIEPDPELLGTLLTLKSVIPEKTRETARRVVRKVVEEIERRLKTRLVSEVRQAISHVSRTRRPRPKDIDWDRTIRGNLQHYLPELKTIIPVRLVGKGRAQRSLQEVILCVDQSGSMATSVVYAGILGAVLASIRSLRTQMVVFDTEVVDLTEHLNDPVELLFGTQLGGGTDINRAIAYCQPRIASPEKTTLVLITDLFEGGNSHELLHRLAELVISGVNIICLLALNDDGRPAYNHQLAQSLGAMGIPTFACTPDQFPDLMSTTIQRGDLTQWAARNDIPLCGAQETPAPDPWGSLSSPASGMFTAQE